MPQGTSQQWDSFVPWGHLAMAEDIFISHKWGKATFVRDKGPRCEKYPPVHKIAPNNRITYLQMSAVLRWKKLCQKLIAHKLVWINK